MAGHEDWVRCVCFNPQCTLLFSGSLDKTIRVWSVQGNAIAASATLSGHEAMVTSLVANQELLFSGSFDTSIRVWSQETNECLHILRHHQDSVVALCLQKDHLFSGSSDGCVKVSPTLDP